MDSMDTAMLENSSLMPKAWVAALWSMPWYTDRSTTLRLELEPSGTTAPSVNDEGVTCVGEWREGEREGVHCDACPDPAPSAVLAVG